MGAGKAVLFQVFRDRMIPWKLHHRLAEPVGGGLKGEELCNIELKGEKEQKKKGRGTQEEATNKGECGEAGSHQPRRSWRFFCNWWMPLNREEE